MTSANCHYCGIAPQSIASPGKQYTEALVTFYIYNGIDRVDNTKGYTLDNCVTCCINCNRAKMDRSLEEFLAHVTRIATHLKLV